MRMSLFRLGNTVVVVGTDMSVDVVVVVERLRINRRWR